ncbi:Glycosyl_hydrolase family 25 protein [Hexamita inflata]|uniref:Glycosyl hydrolase family 25 protein n=1 Tax=Hexamita inflata TaxID=28002 RepID=A0AA86NFG7_9EUKA|nr:Glycosyl hydrolase family 25 protein [Hexamita inflata]
MTITQSISFIVYYYDNSQSFSDFQSFGGWTKPSIKQYQGDVAECSTQIDRNFY